MAFFPTTAPRGWLMAAFALLASAVAVAAAAAPAVTRSASGASSGASVDDARPPLRIAVIQRSGTQQVAARILEAVYARAGIPMRIVALPATRATQMADRGEIDGEGARIASYYEERPGVVVVRPALMRTAAMVFMREADARPVRSAADLRGLRVGIVRGVRQSQAAVAGVERVEQLNTARQLYQMLHRGHLDAVVDSPVSQKRYAATLGVDGVVAVGTLSEMEVFHGLQARHAALAPRLGEVLAAMAASGELAKVQAEAEADATRPAHASPWP